MPAVGEEPDLRRAWAVWGVAAALYFAAVFHRMALGVAGLRAEERLHVAHSQLAAFTVVQFAVYLLMQTPAGVAADRFGPRRVLAVGVSCMALGEALFSVAHGLPLGLVGRGLVGVGDALVFLNVLQVAQRWFPRRMGSLLAVLTGVIGALGQLVGTVPLELALDGLGWTATFASSAALTGLLAFVALRFVQDWPPGATPPVHTARAHPLELLRGAARERATRHGFWIHLALFCPFQTIGALWGVPFLVEGQDLSRADAAGFLLLLTATFAVTGPVVGLLGGRDHRTQDLLVLGTGSLALAAWAAVLAWPGGEPPVAMLLLTFACTGLAASGGMLAFDVARRRSAAAAGSVSALVNCGGYLAGSASMLLTGLLLGSQDASASAYQHALLPMLALSGFGLVMVARQALGFHRGEAARPPARAVDTAAG